VVLFANSQTKIIKNPTQTPRLIFAYLGSRVAYNLKPDSLECLLQPAYQVSGGVFLACPRQPVSSTLLTRRPSPYAPSPCAFSRAPLLCTAACHASPPLSLVRGTPTPMTHRTATPGCERDRLPTRNMGRHMLAVARYSSQRRRRATTARRRIHRCAEHFK
jgi:hypothetical protein